MVGGQKGLRRDPFRLKVPEPQNLNVKMYWVALYILTVTFLLMMDERRSTRLPVIIHPTDYPIRRRAVTSRRPAVPLRRRCRSPLI